MKDITEAILMNTFVPAMDFLNTGTNSLLVVGCIFSLFAVFLTYQIYKG